MNCSPLLGAAFVTALGLCLHGAFAPTARAELPPYVYEQLQKDAPEALLLEVTHVTRTVRAADDRNLIEIAATAMVRGVTRSAKGTKTGTVISLHYESFEITAHGWAGPSPVPQVEAGKHYKAWLQKTWTAETGVRYVPAAKGWSFESVAGAPAVPIKRPWIKRRPWKQ